MRRHHQSFHRKPRVLSRRAAPGSPPGTLTAHPDAMATRIVMHRFGPETFDEKLLLHIKDIATFRNALHCLWVEVTGLANIEIIRALGHYFKIHELSLEDAIDPTQRGKVEQFEHYTFVAIKTLVMSAHIESNQLSIFLGDRFILTLTDISNPALEPVRERLRSASGKIRDRAADYLTYALIDSVIDHYFPIVEQFDDRLESVEDAILEAQETDPIDLAKVVRQDLQTIRHVVWPTRDVIRLLLHEDAARITEETRLHFRDCYDHILQLQEMIEASREIAASLLELYISRISLRTNEVMRVLTIIATIFIPLTFIVGLYGMNFNPRSSPFNMPELDWYWGYPFSLLIMLGTVVGTLLYFRRMGWYNMKRKRREDSNKAWSM